VSITFEYNLHWAKSKQRNHPPETVFYEEGNVRITNLLANFGIDRYSIWTLTSARQSKRADDRWILFSLIVFASLLTSDGVDDRQWAFFVLGILIAGYVLYVSERAKPEYIVQLDSPYGQVEAYTSHSEEEAEKIVAAINQAIAQKEDL
jgi:hypothetical protein